MAAPMLLRGMAFAASGLGSVSGRCAAPAAARWQQQAARSFASPSLAARAAGAAAAAAPAAEADTAAAVAAKAAARVINSSDTLPLHTGRPRLVVLGTGWAAARLLRDIDPKSYDLTVVSPRNHMVFTPLLASTTVGTLEPRSVAVHMLDIQPALFHPQNGLYIGEALSVDPSARTVSCRSEDGMPFLLKYDKLVLATGSQGSTFGIPGVLEHAHFLRDVKQAEAIRYALISNLAQAGIPGRPQEEWQRLLHIVIVGGGPTGVEVAGELTDLISHELKKLYPDRARAMRVTLIEGKELLGSFDGSLREYAARKLIRAGVVLRKGVVKQVTEREIELRDGTVIPYGLCIWSTGVGPTPFTLSLPFAKTVVGRLAVDKYMRVLTPPAPAAASPLGGSPSGASPAGTSGKAAEQRPAANGQKMPGMLADESDTPATSHLRAMPDVYALGDCCANPDAPLPALAQVAEQQGRYLASVLNAEAKGPAYGESSGPPAAPEFKYRHLGSMATVGQYGAVLELGDAGSKGLSAAGFLSWVAWRSAYLTRLGSIPKRLSVAFDWTLTMVFGRDLSRW